MSKKRVVQDVQWYLRGHKRPYAQSTVAESDYLNALLDRYDGRFSSILEAFDAGLWMYNENEYLIVTQAAKFERDYNSEKIKSKKT